MTIFFGREGREAVYVSTKRRAAAVSDEGSRGYCRNIRPIRVSSSPLPSMRRVISTLGLSEKDIR
jgi:hypothetical protein